MDTLTITALSVNTIIGVHEWEKRITQPLLIDISITTDFSTCEDNDLSTTIDYEALCQEITHFTQTHTFQLIETLAYKLAQVIIQKSGVIQATITVNKPHAIANAKNISVTVTKVA